MAAAEDFNILDTQVRDIFKRNNPQNNRVYWIVTERYPDAALIDSYKPDTNEILSEFPTLVGLNDLNVNYTYFRRNSVDPLYGGRKRKRRSRKSRRNKKVKRRRRTRKY